MDLGLYNHTAKELLARYSVPVPQGGVASSAAEARAELAKAKRLKVSEHSSFRIRRWQSVSYSKWQCFCIYFSIEY